MIPGISAFIVDLPPDRCHLPRPMESDDAQVYRMLREAHCERKQASHECSGRITIDRNGVTASCPLCGDARLVYPPTGAGMLFRCSASQGSPRDEGVFSCL